MAQAPNRPTLGRPASGVNKNAAKRLRAKEGGGREEENRPEISTRRNGRLRN
jgi:hypothetical protein